ncbi:rab-GTPase-TBC domain-containing protein [Phyllosticta capitalensis]|uniref:rab-GTPase-TBC domain-containing protein n=1 Tax=Phyllosticta capitalensis TaxID=121624 RepID=UPI00312D3B3A
MASSSASASASASKSSPGPPSPTASFYDMSDDEEGDYNTIKHTTSGKGVKLLFAKSKVYVHPTRTAKDNIPGFIALVQQKSASSESSNASSSSSATASSLLLSWLPESSLGDAYSTYVKLDLSDSSSPPRQSYLVPPPPTTSHGSSALGTYAFAVPVSEIFSLMVRPPSIGWWFGSVVINTRAGDSFPALFFHDSECQSTIMQRKKLAKESFDPFSEGGNMFWGGDEVLRWLKRYVRVVRSTAEPSIFLIEPSEADIVGFGQGPNADKKNPREESSAAAQKKGPGGMDPITNALKQAQWTFLEKMSQVTTFTRRTAQAVAENPNVPQPVRQFMKSPEVERVQNEFDSARLYLARWAMSIAEQSERERNQRIWTAKDVLQKEDSEVGEFEILDMEAANMSLSDRRRPVTLDEWKGFFDLTTGRLIVTPEEVKERIFHGGLDPKDGVRREAWPFLLGIYEWDSMEPERQAIKISLIEEYERLTERWEEVEKAGDSGEETEEMTWWREQKHRIEKDVHRADPEVLMYLGSKNDKEHGPTRNEDFESLSAEDWKEGPLAKMREMLLNYNEYNKDLGYVQGMSDLLAPIYVVMVDERFAFWLFVGFMERMERNFLRDQSGMRLQLLTLDQLVQLMDPTLYLHLQKLDSTNFFFFFRMLLVWYKREFNWDDVLTLWERLWTDYLSSNFHLFIALAILEKHRDIIMTHLQGFDEVLKYVNELKFTIDLPSTLVRAEALFRRFQRTVAAVDKKNARSSLPIPSTAKLLLRQRRRFKAAASAQARRAAAAAGRGSSSALPQSGNNTPPDDDDDERKEVISDELRALLSREVPRLERDEQRGAGERGIGEGSARARGKEPAKEGERDGSAGSGSGSGS